MGARRVRHVIRIPRRYDLAFMKVRQRFALISLIVGLACLPIAGELAFNPAAGALIFKHSTYGSDAGRLPEATFVAVFIAVFGIVQLIQSVVVWRIARRAPAPPAPDSDLDRLEGPFGVAAGRALDVRRVYVVPVKLPAALCLVVVTPLISAASAVRVNEFVFAACVGAALGLAFVGYLLWANRRSSVVVGPDGLTRRGPWRARTTPWVDVVSVGVERRGYTVRIRKPGAAPQTSATTAINLSAYARVSANASMQRLIGMYLGGLPPPSPPPSAAAAPPAAPLRRAGMAIRMGAWLIDVVVLSAIIFVVAVFVDVAMAAFHGGVVVPADAGPALWIAALVTIPGYLIVSWRMGHTAGMALLRLRVINASTGALPTWRQSAVRFAAALPSMLLGLPLGLLFALGSERLALHDTLAGTAVVSTVRHPVAFPQVGLPEG